MGKFWFFFKTREHKLLLNTIPSSKFDPCIFYFFKSTIWFYHPRLYVFKKAQTHCLKIHNIEFLNFQRSLTYLVWFLCIMPCLLLFNKRNLVLTIFNIIISALWGFVVFIDTVFFFFKFYICSKLIDITFLQEFTDQLKLRLMTVFWRLLLLLNYQGIAIF